MTSKLSELLSQRSMIDDEIVKRSKIDHQSMGSADGNRSIDAPISINSKIPVLPPLFQERIIKKWRHAIQNDRRNAIMTKMSYKNKHYGKKLRAILIVEKFGLRPKNCNRRKSTKLEIKSLVLIEQGGRCAGLFATYGRHLPCRRKILSEENTEIDHIIELQYGGADLYINLQALCPDCHKKKTSGNRKLSRHAPHQHFY